MIDSALFLMSVPELAKPAWHKCADLYGRLMPANPTRNWFALPRKLGASSDVSCLYSWSNGYALITSGRLESVERRVTKRASQRLAR